MDEAVRDMRKLDGSQRALVFKAIEKVREDPTAEGYGKPLGNKSEANLVGLFKIKLRESGIRVVYQLVEVDGVMRIVIVGMRTEDEIYREAARRLER